MTLKSKLDWPALIKLQRQSGLSKAAFCQQQKLSRSSFSYYDKLYRKAVSGPAAPAPQFSSFVAVSPKQEFKLRINDSFTLSFDSPPEVSWLSSLIQLLGEAHARP